MSTQAMQRNARTTPRMQPATRMSCPIPRSQCLSRMTAQPSTIPRMARKFRSLPQQEECNLSSWKSPGSHHLFANKPNLGHDSSLDLDYSEFLRAGERLKSKLAGTHCPKDYIKEKHDHNVFESTKINQPSQCEEEEESTSSCCDSEDSPCGEPDCDGTLSECESGWDISALISEISQLNDPCGQGAPAISVPVWDWIESNNGRIPDSLTLVIPGVRVGEYQIVNYNAEISSAEPVCA